MPSTPTPRNRRILAAAAALALSSAPALATNGMNMIGYGAVSSAMGGADLAIVDNPSAMNINPAGICECTTPELDARLSLLMPRLTHEDRLGNDRDGEDNVFPLPFLAYVHPVGRLSLGLGLFAQGGMGAEFTDLTTPFAAFAANPALPPGFFAGDRIPSADGTFTNVMFARLTPTVAWRVTPRFTVGRGWPWGTPRPSSSSSRAPRWSPTWT